MTLEINDKQEKWAEDWLKHHNCGPIFLDDPRVCYESSYIITPTNIGHIVEVRCNKCGQIHDITDYETW